MNCFALQIRRKFGATFNAMATLGQKKRAVKGGDESLCDNLADDTMARICLTNSLGDCKCRLSASFTFLGLLLQYVDGLENISVHSKLSVS